MGHGPGQREQGLQVVVPLLTLVPGGMGGSETYVRHLVHELDRRQDVEVTVVVGAGAAGELDAGTELVDRRVRGGPSTVQRLRSLGQAMRAPENAVGRALTDADLVHYPLTVPLPRVPRGVPRVQSLLDVQHLDLPGMFSRAERAYRRLAYDRPARTVDRVLTLSAFCRDRIHQTLGIARDRIDVVPLGVDTTTFSPGPDERQDFVLYPARTWPHKNHARLIQAMEVLRRDRPGLRLVLTGGGTDQLGPVPEWVETRGLVSVLELASLYRRAACLAYPSLNEGFGLPPLESMASDCPVAASWNGALPEVCGDAAVLFDPEDVAAIASGIGAAIDGRDRLVARGRERLQLYTWAACGDAHVAAYRRAVEAGARRG